MEALAGERPGDAVLSEEGVDDPVRLSSQRVWIVDPLDGTREFSELGRQDWAVHVALWQSGDWSPARLPCPRRASRWPPPIPHRHRHIPGEPRIVVSRTRPPAIALQVRDELNGTLVEMGSAGAKVAAVIQGLADVYVHAGGQYEWDSAAPVAVARAAGLHTSRIDGRRWSTTGPIRSCPTWWCAARNTPTRCSRSPAERRPVGESHSMRMSAKAEYAVRAMVELATVGDGVRMTTDELANAQGIPPQFLVDILSALRTDHLVRSHRGRDGGYELSRPGTEISIADVLRCIDGPLASVRDIGLGDLPYSGSDRGADRRLAGAAGQHAIGAGRDQPGRRRAGALPEHVGRLADDYRAQETRRRGPRTAS